MYLNFRMSGNHTITQSIPGTHNGFIYVLNGTAYIGDPNSETEAKAHCTLLFSEGSTRTVKIQTKDEAAHFTLIAGELLREAVVQIGPFVVNTCTRLIGITAMGWNGFERRRTRNSDDASK